MKKIASELLVERLVDWGVEVVFGLPGEPRASIASTLLRDRLDRMRS